MRAEAALLHTLFEERAAERPDAVALECEDVQLTFGELDRRTNRLARRLRSLGVGPEHVIGLHVRPGAGLVIGLLGILKAGAAYLPLDPDHPDERLCAMARDAGAQVVVTEAASLASGWLGLQQVCADGDDVARQSPEPVTTSGHPAGLAYVIYTSGSTGTPKGLMATHAATINRFEWMWAAYPFAPGEVCCQKTSIGFVDAVWEILGPLLAGVRLAVLPAPALRDPRALLTGLERTGSTRIVLVPSLLRALLAAGASQARLPALRWWSSSGETLRAVTGADLRERMPGATLLNLYGASEVAGDVTCGEVGPDHGTPPTIGKALTGVFVYVLDEQLDPVPPGSAGEICVGGVQVARGYAGHADQTAERFVPDPFGASGSRMYRTGDLSRRLASGELEYLGRRDRQVKVRGQRVELGEVEAALEAQTGVREAAVVTSRGPDGGVTLLAVVAGDTPWSELRERLRARLPEAALPSAMVAVRALPRTPHGKVDREALRDLEPVLPTTSAAPAGQLEAAVAKVWRDVLGLDHVGADDSFFELGGNSLLAAQVVWQLQTALGVELPAQAVFDAPTVAALARAAADAPAATGPDQTGAAVWREQQAALSYGQQRLWFLDQLVPGNPFYNMPASWRMRGQLGVEALERALAHVVARHEVLRTRFPSRDGRPVQVVEPAVAVVLDVVDLEGLDEAAREDEAWRLARAEAAQPFDLAAGPPLRSKLLRLSDEDHVLVVTLHHIVSDGWSMRVLAAELSELYADILNGREARLQPLPTQYADFAAWQRSLDALLGRQLEHWLRQLDGAPRVLELPAARPRPAMLSYRGSWKGFRVDSEVLDRLRRLDRGRGVTLFMTLLAAFQVLLWKYTGQADVVVGTPAANRPRRDLDGLIGFFLNTLVMRTRLDPDMSFEDLLNRVRRMCLAAYANQDLPFEQLVEALQPERDPSRNPLVQVLFLLQQEQGRQALSLPGLTTERFEGRWETVTHFDLELHMRELDGALTGRFVYSTELFDEGTVARMVGHFQQLLAELARAPTRRLADVSLVGDEERTWLIDMGLGPATSPVRGLAELLAPPLAGAPNAVAVESEPGQLTYAELDARANQVAHRLRRLGTGPEARVGLLMERSLELAIAVLGVLKAGAAYVPLDPGYPTARLEVMMRDADCAVVLTTAAIGTARRDLAGAALRLDADWAAFAGEPRDCPAPAARPDNLAYVMFTSGSTGRPKGIGVPFAVLANLVAWHLGHPTLGRPARTLQFASPSFDASVQEMLTTWATGGTLVIAPDEARRDPELLARLLARSAVRRLYLPFVALQQLAESVTGREVAPICLTEIVAAGEQLRVTADVSELCRALDGCVLSNHYGPTESHVVTYLDLSGEPEAWPALPAIGRPIPNAAVYVLDASLAPVPAGVVGELYIGGATLARGYVAQPGLTGDRFLPDPLAAAPGARMYRTGDLAAWQADGTLRFLGRRDHQVKIRGFRVEPAEVEAALEQHPRVVEAAVAVVAEGGRQQLVAYVVEPRGAASGDEAARQLVEEWREFFDVVQTGGGDPRFNTAGWEDRANGRPIPAAEMAEYVDATVAQIASLGGRRFLEIGCGTGLLLWRLAGFADHYVGSDLSGRTIAELRQHVAHAGLSNVLLEEREAIDFRGVEPGSFDVVVLASVVRFFPDAHYLETVLNGALAAIGGHGAVFVGDVMNLPLLEPFLLAVATSERGGEGSGAGLVEAVRRAAASERELILDPRFFVTYAARRGLAVEVLPKRGRLRNEMTCYRYDVVLRPGPARLLPVERWWDWPADEQGRLHELLTGEAQPFGLRRVANARVQGVVARWAALAGGRPASPAPPAWDPEAVCELAADLGWTAQLSWATGWPDGAFDVVFVPGAESAALVDFGLSPLPDAVGLAHEPLASAGRAADPAGLMSELRSFLHSRLPAYMVPSAFVLMERLPLNANGKLDRGRLPAPESVRPELRTALLEPRTPVERTVADIWASVLGLDRVGVEDDFFELGGHSLLATQVIARVRDALGVQVPLRTMFDAPTVTSLAAAIEQQAPDRDAVEPRRPDDIFAGVPMFAVPPLRDRYHFPSAPDLVGPAGR